MYTLTDSIAWMADDSAAAEILLQALMTYAHDSTASTPIAEHESNTFIRVIATLIDPRIYRGAGYGLMTGNNVHRVLFESVAEVVKAYAANGFEAYDTRVGAARALAEVATAWPTVRDGMLRNGAA